MMISTHFTMETTKITDRRQSCLAIIVALVAGYALGLYLTPSSQIELGLFLSGPLGALGLGGGVLYALEWNTPKQYIITTIQSDGNVISACNERDPDINSNGKSQIFNIYVDDVAACESANAYDLFGINITIGNYVALPTTPPNGNPNNLAGQQIKNKGSTAIFIRGAEKLHLIYAGYITNALSYQIVTQINQFLADARALRIAPPASPPPTSGVSTSASGGIGFDL